MEREGFTLWLTGIPGSGKSTLARAVSNRLRRRCCAVEVLDGDEMRRHLCQDLTFSKKDRDANVMRLGIVARLLSRNGVAVIVAAVSPYHEARDRVRAQHDAPFFEVFVDCSLHGAVRRDPKGLYQEATRGEIQNLTGLDDPYEPPMSPEIHVCTEKETVDECVSRILTALETRGVLTLEASTELCVPNDGPALV